MELECKGNFTALFTFESGEALTLKQHYATLGEPQRDAASGKVVNAVLVLHGTTGSGGAFLAGARERFALPLFGPGGPLDARNHYIILPDGIGHGRSSRPSDGLRMQFPQYTYNDMVKAQHLLLTEHLKVDHLLLVTGTSMGGMHTWLWGCMFPTFMDALFPLASLPVEIAGVNRMVRKSIVDAIVEDPEFADGNYPEQRTTPLAGQKAAVRMMAVRMNASPLQWQAQAPTRKSAEQMLDDLTAALLAIDPCDMVYAFEASRYYNPAPTLLKIQAPLTAVNSADDQVNPPELLELEKGVERLRQAGRDARAVVLPVSAETRGHGTHTIAALWQNELVALLRHVKVARAGSQGSSFGANRHRL